jgi:hypothetical protein
MGQEEVELRSAQDRLVMVPVDGRDTVRMGGVGVKLEPQPVTQRCDLGGVLERPEGETPCEQEA